MDETLDRRNGQRERIPLQLSAELGHGDFEDPFAADVVNLSKGGLSMRAACLPDIGSRLSCRFRCVPSGALVCAEGEVVWAHLDGENSGEFGLAFVDLDPKTEWLIEEMIAEQVACSGAPSKAPIDVGAPVTTLVLEGSREAIDARLARDGDDVAVFEQELQLLRVGRGVRAETDGFGGRSGSIAAVELRMVGSVPMLAVTVEFAPHTALPDTPSASLPLPAPEPASTRPRAAAPQQLELPHDTEPDLHSPQEMADADLDAVFGADRSASEPELQAQAIAARSLPPNPRERDVSVSFKVPEREAEPQPKPAPAVAYAEDDPDLDFEAMVRPSWKPALDRLVARATAALSALSSSSVARGALPQLRGALLRMAAFVRAIYGRTLATQLGALRRLIAGAVAGRRRRTTTGRAQARGASASLGRTLAVGLLGAGAAGFAVYALMPNDGDRIQLHRSVHAETGAPQAAPVPTPAAERAQRSSAAPAAASPGGLARGAAPDPRAVPSATTVPAGSPFAVDVRGARPAEAKPAPGKPLRFGAASVPKARKYALRMSTKVQNLSGVADAGGFTITALGSLSLDRAGPIASSHKSVARAMIINRGDRAELSIRFADGKRPAYQVSAEGATLYVLIEDT